MAEKQEDFSLDPFEVKVKMMRHRITLTRIAKKLHVTHQAISLALFGKSPKLLVRINTAIDKILTPRASTNQTSSRTSNSSIL